MAGRSPLHLLSEDERAQFQERLRIVVKALGTQKKAASVAEVSIAQMKNYLSGRSAPPAQVLNRLGKTAGYSVDWLVSGARPKLPTGIAAQREASGVEEEETPANAMALASRLRGLLDLLESGLADIYGKLDDESEEAILDPLLELIAPNQHTPPNWRELANLALESHRGAQRLQQRP